jgi:hypothetical protein
MQAKVNTAGAVSSKTQCNQIRLFDCTWVGEPVRMFAADIEDPAPLEAEHLYRTLDG